MSTYTSRGAGGHAAQNDVSGRISNGVTWYEDVKLVDQDGNQITGVDLDIWQFQFRKIRTDAADLTLSTTAGTLTITEGATETILGIRAAQSVVSEMAGDYFADLVSKAASDDRLIHRAHGIVTFLDDPIAF